MTERSVFLAALDILDRAARAAYIEETCAGNPALRRGVEELLAAHERSGRFLDGPAPDPGETVDQPPLLERPGTLIGPYKLLQQIGEGGMGAVFMAEQEKPVRRRVALKVIKPGMDSAQVIARFEAERQALALMDHQNIARVLDAGTTESGRPFFVMELVHGVPITKYCDDNQLTLKERLELFVPVCQAIQHAHQKGIIHRDMKPSNVLVTLYDGKPVPKVIDFGVAKATEQRLTERTMFTQYGTIVGTLEYMSPEQAEMSALGVDTRSDIYSLGVLLYELLTGSTPLEKAKLRESAYAELLRKIREEEPERPSTRLSHSGNQLATISAHRKTEPAKLARLVRGELDWIVMKALEKDRTRRYETANGLARDVQRYLQDEPVEACPPSAGYRLRKLLRRNKGPLLAAASVLAALLIGLVGTTLLFVEAQSARRAEMVARRAAEQARDAARHEAAKAEAINKFLLNDVLSAMAPDQAASSAITFEDVLRAAAEQVGPTFRDQPELAAAIRVTIGGTELALGRHEEAERQLQTALETRRRVLGNEHRETLRVMERLTVCYVEQGKLDRAEPLIRSAIAIQRSVLGEEDPDTLRSQIALVWILYKQDRLAEAEALGRQTLEAQRRVFADDSPEVQGTSSWLMWSLLALRRPGEAEELARGCLESQLRVHGEGHLLTANAMDNLGVILLDLGKRAEAKGLFTKALATRRRVLGPGRGPTAIAMFHLAGALAGERQWAEAEPLCRQAVEGLRKSFSDGNDLTLYAIEMLARILRMQGKPEEAESLLRDALDRWRKTGAGAKAGMRRAMLGLASLLESKGKLTEAEALLREVVAQRETGLGDTHPDVVVARFLLGQNLIRQAKFTAAEAILREALAADENTHPDGWQQFNTMSLLGGVVLAERKYAEAEALLLKGYDGAKAHAPKDVSALVLTHAAQRLIELYGAWGKPELAAKWRKEREEIETAASAGSATRHDVSAAGSGPAR